MDVSVTLQADASAARRARLFAADTLAAWSCPVDGDDVALIVSELSTNAVRYDGPQLTVGLSWGDGELVVQVLDSNATPGTPTLHANVDAGAESGRGLQIVDALAGRWGVEQSSRGTRVWATLSLT